MTRKKNSNTNENSKIISRPAGERPSCAGVDSPLTRGRRGPGCIWAVSELPREGIFPAGVGGSSRLPELYEPRPSCFFSTPPCRICHYHYRQGPTAPKKRVSPHRTTGATPCPLERIKLRSLQQPFLAAPSSAPHGTFPASTALFAYQLTFFVF